MTNKLETLLNALKAQDQTASLVGLEARVWQRLDAERPRKQALVAMQALRALPVIIALVMGSAAGAGAMASQNELSAFSAIPAYSVSQLVQ